MKKTRTLLAMLCAVVAALVLALPAWAATGTYDITINSKTGGHTYEAYQVFAGDLDTEEDTLTGVLWGDGVDGDALLTALKAAGQDNPFNGYTGGNPFALATTAAEVAKAMEGFDTTWTDTFADMVDAHLTATSGRLSGPVGTNPYVYTISDVASGYYFIKDKDDSLGEAPDNAYTKFMLQVVHSLTVDAKADQPPIDKSITGVNNGPDIKLDNADAAIGDTVEFTLSSRVPNMDGYNKYFFIVNDTLSKGLALAADFGSDDVAVTFTNPASETDPKESVTIKPDAYTVAVTPNGDGTTGLQISFNNFLQYASAPTNYQNWDISIVYSATVDQDAVIGNAGNPNEVTLTYSNDPNFNYDGEGPEPDDPMGITPKSTVKVFVTGLQIVKTDEGGEPLTGAEFKLEGTALNTVKVTRGEFQEDADGTYYLLKDGTYTTQAPNDQTANKYQNTTTKYVLTEVTEYVQKAEQVEYKGYVDDGGIIRFDGLKGLTDGTYTLTETVVPDGYNGIDPITFKVTFNAPSDQNNNQASWTFTSDNATFTDMGGDGAQLGVYTTTIKNMSGATLPSTGGIGTTIFYAVGAILVVGAGVILVSRHRANSMK